MKEQERGGDCLYVRKRGELLKLPIYEIDYIESNAHKLLVHIGDTVYEYNDKMDSVEELLKDSGFIRCHQSYLVNTDRVSVIRTDKLVVSGNEIKISRRYRDIVKQQFNGRLEEWKSRVSGDEMNILGGLLCVNGPYTGKRYSLVPGQEIVVGRDGEQCDIVINLPKISRRHFLITWLKNEECFEITDFSTNGIYINGDIRLEKNNRYEISAGDTIDLGDGVTRFKLI